MAGRILNRRELRNQADQANQLEAHASTKAPTEMPPAKKTKTKKASKEKAPLRLRARWGIFDARMKQVAVFEYHQRAAAQDRLADLLAKKKSLYFLQVVKEPTHDPTG
ncbi:MAG: hypothetical protein HY000_39675 [Planctomycetes bacterium]|nr:hypothetical protein [Planctomycetota bacterium]